MKKKVLRVFIVFIVLILAIAAVASAAVIWRNALVKMLLTGGIKRTTGVNVMIEEVDVNFVPSTIKLRNTLLFNPSGYGERIMADIPDLFLDYDLKAILQRNLHFRKVRLDLRKLTIIKDKHGRVNVDYLKKAKKKEGMITKKEKQAATTSFKIDRLELKIGKIIYRNYTPGAAVSDLELDLYTRDVFKNITSPRDVVRIVLARAVARTVIQDLVGVGLDSAGQPDMADLFRKAMKKALGAAFEKFGDKIKFPSHPEE